MNSALYLLRAKQLGLSIADMEQIDESIVFDMMVESANDYADESYVQLATQSDFDRF